MPTSVRIGTELAGYRLEELVGRGGMGVVYRARDLALDRDVALKLLAPGLADDVSFRERFLKESRVAASLEHPNVVPIHDAGEIEGQLYIVMRLVEGSDLRAVLREGPLEPARAVRILEQVAGALDAAHARGLVHRDVKPSNVLLDQREHVYLADFGLSRYLGDAAIPLGPAKSLGTADYVAPEQIRGEEVDGRADVYALGCVLYECLAGEPPFRRDSDAATLFAQLEAAPPVLPGLEGVLPKALAKEPDERYGTCGELVEDSVQALGIAEPQRSRWPITVAAVGVALVAAALTGFFLTRDGGGGGAPPGQGGRLLRIDPASNRVTASMPVGDGPAAVAVGSGRVWVASYRDGTLWQLDPTSRAPAKVAAVGRPFAVTIHDGSAYVAALGPGQFTGNVSKFDARTGDRAGGKVMVACSLAGGTFGVWVAGCPDVQKLSTGGPAPTFRATVHIPYAARLSAANFREALAGMAQGEGAVWVIGDAADRRLWRIDPQRHRVTATIDLGFPPGAVAAGEGGVWVTDELGDRVVRIDPATNRAVASIPVGRGAMGVAVGGGSVWIADATGHSLTRIDPTANRVTATVRVPASPQAVAVGDGSVWTVGDGR
jgi:DNA-binding beta-propeller fold protein YncE